MKPLQQVLKKLVLAVESSKFSALFNATKELVRKRGMLEMPDPVQVVSPCRWEESVCCRLIASDKKLSFEVKERELSCKTQGSLCLEEGGGRN